MAPQVMGTAKTHILQDCDLRSILQPAPVGESQFNATKVTITIGPATQSVDILIKMLEADVACARLDLTWGSLEFHRQSLENLYEAQRRTGKLCAIMLDTTGRELMVQREYRLDANGWPVHENILHIKAGQTVILTPDVPQTPRTDGAVALPISYDKFAAMTRAGDMILMGRYLATGAEESSAYLQVQHVSTETGEVVCTSGNDCSLEGLVTLFHVERSNTSVENVQNDLPVLCEQDKKAIEYFARNYEIDFISLSYTRSKEDVLEVREYIDKLGLTTTKLVAKCETRQSLLKFSSIVAASDGVIISRGNLGLDVMPEKMALTQKRMVTICNIAGKPCYITRVVDTMIQTPRPTRAEATDIANAVLDGVDGILLGAETLRGKYPVITVKTIMQIAHQADKVFDHSHHYEYLVHMKALEGKNADEEGDYLSKGTILNRTASMASMGSSDGHNSATTLNSNWNLTNLGRIPDRQLSIQESIAASAVRTATKVGASMIIVYTHSGATAALVSKYRPPMPILTLVVPTLLSEGLRWKLHGTDVARQCLIQHGLLVLLSAPSLSGEILLDKAVAKCTAKGIIKPLDHIVVVQKVHDDLTLKIVSVDETGRGVSMIRPKSLQDLVVAAGGADERALRQSFSVIGGDQEMVAAEECEQISLSPRSHSLNYSDPALPAAVQAGLHTSLTRGPST